jgi:hypothetical protein
MAGVKLTAADGQQADGSWLGLKCNQSASHAQANARKTKQNRLYFLLFPWPNRGFSMGYRRKNKKILLALNSRPGLRLTDPKLLPSRASVRPPGRHRPSSPLPHMIGSISSWSNKTSDISVEPKTFRARASNRGDPVGLMLREGAQLQPVRPGRWSSANRTDPLFHFASL